MTSRELKILMFGLMAGIFIFVGSLGVVSMIAGIKWQPVKIEQN